MAIQNGGQDSDSKESGRIIEQVGKVRLDLTHYSGEDLYCDGEVEDELLAIARNYAAVEYPRIIEEKKSWPVLYHLSMLRENIVEWLPIDKSMKVLEIGSGCGAITGVLAKKAGQVTCIELSKKRSMINAYRHMECDNVTIHVGNFQDIEPDLERDYDFICLIGVFEYGKSYIDSDTPYEDFLRIVASHRKPMGHIAIAIENKFGLKYWAGCKEDHLGTWFSSLEDYPGDGPARTFTADGLLRIAGSCGLTQAQMYYPYPDYKFMTCLYSDDYLPKPGELSDNLRNFDRERLVLFDEKLVFDTIIKERQFPLFSNSYMLLLGPKLPIQYVKYSNDRAPAHRIKTVIGKKEAVPVQLSGLEMLSRIEKQFGKALSGQTEGKKKETGGNVRYVEKYPLCDEATGHIEQIYRAWMELQKRYASGNLKINVCSLRKDPSVYVSFPYIEGQTLEELLDGYLEREDLDGFYALFDKYLQRIGEGEDCPVTDYDLIFSNILITPSGEWHVIDYEWTFARAMKKEEIAFRAVYCYLLENEKRNKLNLDVLLDKLNITQADAELFRRREREFQQYVTGKSLAMCQIRELINHPVYSLASLQNLPLDREHKGQIQIYEDMGEGFWEDHSYFLEEPDIKEPADRDGTQAVNTYILEIDPAVKVLRIDPCSSRCIVWLKEIKWNGKALVLKGKTFSHNGFRVGENTYAFDTEDPGFTFPLGGVEKQEKNILQISLQVTEMPEETIKHIQKRGLW